MDYQKFIEQLPLQQHLQGEKLRQTRLDEYREYLARIETSLNENIMELLNYATDCLEEEEIYCQVGCPDSGGLIGALLNHPDLNAYVIDTAATEDKLAVLSDDLALSQLEEQVNYFAQELEEFFLDLEAFAPSTQIGVYFCNGEWDYRFQLMSLLLVKPFLAPRALIVVNNSNYSMVQQACYDFLSLCPEAKLMLDLATPKENHYSYGNGLYLISWDRQRSREIDWETIQTNFRNQTVIKAISEAAEKFEKEEKPERVENLSREALYYRLTRQYQEAIDKYTEALAWNRYDANIWDQIGMTYFEKKEPNNAIQYLKKALDLEFLNSIFHYNIAVIFSEIGNIKDAEKAYRKAIEIDPSNVYAYNNLANLLYRRGLTKDAENIYQEAIKINENKAELYFNFGCLMLSQQRWDEAIKLFEKSLELKPRDPDTLEKLGIAFEKKGDLSEANAYFGHGAYRREKYGEAVKYFSLVSEGKDLDFYLNYTDSLAALKRIEESITLYKEGINNYPRNEQLYSRFIIFLLENARVEDAIKISEEALAKLPDSLFLKVENTRILPILYDSAEEIEHYRNRFKTHLRQLTETINLSLLEDKDKEKTINAFFANTNRFLFCQGKNDLELQVEYGSLLHRVMAANYPELTQPLKRPPLGKGEKIRVGFVSAYFANHSGTRWSLGWMKYINNRDFSLYCYHIGSQRDQFTRMFARYSNLYHIPNDFEGLIEQIEKDNLHILIYPELWSHPGTWKVAALRLAPVQCTAWGMTATSGLPTMDYYLSSELMEAENAQEHYSEQLIRLPNLGFCYSKQPRAQVNQDRSYFNLSDENVIYLSSQSIVKYLPQYDYIFPEIAQRVPLAKFVIMIRQSELLYDKFKERLRKAFAKYELNMEDYCVFLPFMLYNPDYLNLNLVSDVYLDTFCFSGLYTTLDAIACNLPVVTCPGEFLRGRQSYGILKLLELEETIAKDETDYINIAVRLGLDKQWRQEIVEKIKANQHRLYDDTTCVRALEDFFRRVVSQGKKRT